MRQNIRCAAQGCPAIAPKILDKNLRPQPPADWYEVVVGRTVYFAHSLKCSQAIAAGVTKAGMKAMSDVPLGE